jgi:hypothetical protein
MNPYAYLALVVLLTLAGLLLMLAAMRKIPEGHRGVQFRMGRLVKELPPGMAWVMPLIDSVLLVDLNEQTIPLPAGLTLAVRDKHYEVGGSFTCKIVAPIPAVMAAMQARQDLAMAVGERVLAALKRMGPAAVVERPAQAQTWVLEALNDQMSQAWQVKFTKLDLTLTAA